MLRKTHISIGIATALAFIRPTTVPSCLFAVMGGAIGGWLPDIDLNTRKKINEMDDVDDDFTDYVKDGVYYDPEIYGEVGNDNPGLFHNNDSTQSAIQLVIIVGVSLLLDKYFQNGLCDYIVENSGIKTIIGLVAFIGLVIIGVHTSHRTFTHSILGCALFSVSVWLIAAPLGIAFVCGYLAHIIIDILNKKPGNQYFWPIKARIYMNLAPTKGDCDNILGNIGVILSIYLFFYFCVPCMIASPRMIELLTIFNSTALTIGKIPFSGLAIYLIAVNIVSFVAFTIERLIFNFSYTWQYSEEDSAAVLTTLWILAFAGGGVGMLLSVLIDTKGHISKSDESNNTTLYLISAVAIAIWVMLVFVISNPFTTDFKIIGSRVLLANITTKQTVFIYFVILNLITFLLIMFKSQKNPKFTFAEILTLILSLIGGATGCYLAMGISNRKMTVHHFSFGIPLMIVVHAIAFSLMAYFGIIT